MSLEIDLCKRFDLLKSNRTVVQRQWDDISRFVTPYRGEFFKENVDEASVAWDRYGNDYGSVAVVSHRKLSAKIHGAITSPSIRWFEMVFRDKALNEDRESSEWLNDVSDLVYNAMRDSNLDLQINETYQDLSGFGTASITLEEMPGPKGQFNGLLFTSIPLKEVYFEEDFMGRVQRFFREIEWTPAQILSKFETGVPERIHELDKAGRTDKQKVLYCVYPANNRVVPVGMKASPSRRPWGHCYILYDDKTTLGKAGGDYEMSVFIPRWLKTSGSVWGNSPGMLAMGDIKSLNRLINLDLVRGEKEVDPPIAVEERSLISDLDLRAGGVSVVRSVTGMKELLPAKQSFSTFERIERLEERIEEYFFVPGLQALLTDNKERTAFEVARMQDEVLQMLGPTMGRIQNDLLSPLVARAFKMMARDGALPPPPQKVVEANAQMDVEYIGPLARAMRMAEANVIKEYVSFGAGMAESALASGSTDNPMDNIDMDAAMRLIGRRMSVPAEVIRDEDDLDDYREEIMEAKIAMQQAVIAEQQGNAALAQQEAVNAADS
jgi:Bacteriophage head to tail connecting protein